MSQLLCGRCGSVLWAEDLRLEVTQTERMKTPNAACSLPHRNTKTLTQEDSKKTRETFSREDLDVNFRQALYKSSVAQTHSFLMKHNRKVRWASLYSFTSFPGSGWTETRTCVTTILPYSPKPAQQRSATKITNGQLPIITTMLMNIIMTLSSSEICGISSHKLHEL